MKRLLCCLLALISLIPFTLAEEPYDSVNVTFEDGFTLPLPADWVSYAVDPALAEQGYIYCLGSADGAQLMYIQRWSTGLTDMGSLREAMASRDEIELRDSENTDGDSLFYSFTAADASGCMLLYESSILNLVFTPQSDANLMLTAAMIAEGFHAE